MSARGGAARRRVLVELCPPGEIIVDVGADHGHVAAAVGAIATERHPRRIGRRDVPWVVADGLRPFRRVDVAIIAGMGAHTIIGILQAGPRPGAAVLHAPDDPPVLRRWLAENGWRIDAEALAPEAGRYAEVLRVVPGEETATGPWLHFGPRLLTGRDPHLRAHLEELHAWHTRLAAQIGERAPEKSRVLSTRAAFLAERLRERDLGSSLSVTKGSGNLP